jgi:ATP-dependent RNA helicase DDX60
MDLEEFNNINELTPSLTTTIYSAEQALEYLDAIWYTNTNRRGRWMDLIGDYAGSELFILDGTRFYFYHPSYLMPDITGESLLQLVLDDSLLALARPDG